MARLRCNNADLNENLFSIKLSTSDICPNCGLHVETIEHYFIYCTAYDTIRNAIVQEIPLEAWNVKGILYGNSRYTNELNTQVQLTAQKYLLSLGRF